MEEDVLRSGSETQRRTLQCTGGFGFRMGTLESSPDQGHHETFSRPRPDATAEGPPDLESAQGASHGAASGPLKKSLVRLRARPCCCVGLVRPCSAARKAVPRCERSAGAFATSASRSSAGPPAVPSSPSLRRDRALRLATGLLQPTASGRSSCEPTRARRFRIPRASSRSLREARPWRARSGPWRAPRASRPGA